MRHSSRFTALHAPRARGVVPSLYPLSEASFQNSRLVEAPDASRDWLIGPAVICASFYGTSPLVRALIEYPRGGHSSPSAAEGGFPLQLTHLPFPVHETHLLPTLPSVLPAVERNIDSLHQLLVAAMSSSQSHATGASVMSIIRALEKHFGVASPTSAPAPAAAESTFDGAAPSDVVCRALQCRLLAISFLMAHQTSAQRNFVNSSVPTQSRSHSDRELLNTAGELLAAMFPVPMPTSMLRSILMLAPPQLCMMILDAQEAAVTHRVEHLNEEHARLLRSADPMLLLSKCVGGQQIASLWNALVSNDHFFHSSSTRHGHSLSSMHRVLMRLLNSVPNGSVTQQSHPHCPQLRDMDWAALLNKTSRVYLNKKRGQELLEMHRLLVQKFAGISLRMPHSYIQRVVGAVFDEAMIQQELEGNIVGSAWHDIAGLLRWAMPLVSQTDHVQRSLIVVGRKAAVQLMHPAAATNGHMKSDAHVTASRLLELYEICAAHRVVSPASSEKDSFQQLTRYVSPAVFEEIIESILSSSDTTSDMAILSLWLTYLEHDVSIKFSWLLDAVLALLRTIQEASQSAAVSNCPKEDVAMVAKRFANHLMQVLEDTLLPGRNAVGVRPRSVPHIRRVLESLRVVSPSPFWWNCGCGAANPACSTHCYSCMRRGRVAWKCGNCAVEHSSSSTSTSSSSSSRSEHCYSCNATHPRYAAAQQALQEVCGTCRTVFDPAMGDCSTCSGHGETPPVSDDTNCQTCGHLMGVNSPLCPRCLSRNLLSDVKLWHCTTCKNYSYSTWSKCQRCAPKVISVKAANALTVPFFTWQCGCGTTQHPCKLGCSACTPPVTTSDGQHQQKFSCSQCHRKSHLRRSITHDYDSTTTLRITLCEHCAFPHPRDHVLLTLPKAVPRPCVACGRSFVAKQGNGLGPQVCSHCLSLQPINVNLPFLCSSDSCSHQPSPAGSSVAESNTSVRPKQWQWGNMECTTCSTLRADVAVYCDAFVWKCLAPRTAAGDEEEQGRGEGDAEEPLDSEACNYWNPSWSSVCLHCRIPRPHAPDEEIRAKYIPWTCNVCHTLHPATALLECPTCHQGRQPPPRDPCASCGLHHIAWRCPTLDQLIEAERILCEMEDERARVRLQRAEDASW
ncbi:Hypothetical protein, putative [Bodo saltans]|uniref:RanBP2-type domain-containing protein n=1 Tax=Bodo saltans TaxID=75058 RepID=A0A0S4JKR3_BODSA|nr:Hypothetical protein, putative [Bodo saltans]|eukprot:CUG92133.1 Hypothetical protein, putative [Bodo saltans]